MADWTPRGLDAPGEISDEYVESIMRKMAVPSAVYSNESRRAQAVDRIRRDLWLGVLAGFTNGRAHEKLDIRAPIIFLNGRHDPVVPIGSEREIASAFGLTPRESHIIEGSHLFVTEAAGRRQTAGILSAALKRLMTTGPSHAERLGTT